jgi:hypothetical protein
MQLAYFTILEALMVQFEEPAINQVRTDDRAPPLAIRFASLPARRCLRSRAGRYTAN